MRCFSGEVGTLPPGDAGELGWSRCCVVLFNRLPRGLAPGWLAPAGGWEALAIASGAVRPSSPAQLWMWGQSRCPSCGSCSAAVSARIIAVMAVLRSRLWPGSQDTSQPFRSGACRAVWAVWSLVMVVSLMVRVMAVTSGLWSLFGFQVGLGFAVALFAGL